MRRVPVKINLAGTRKSLAPTWHRGPPMRSVKTGIPRRLEPHRAIRPPMPMSIEFALKAIQCIFNAHFTLSIQFHIALGNTGDLDEIWVLKARRPSAIEVSEPDAPLK